jgi:inner membrane protein
MMSITHAALAGAVVPILLSSSDPMIFGLAVLGSQLPDIDTTTSLIGQVCYPLSSWIESRFPHRSATHSFVAIATVALAWWFIEQRLNLSRMEWFALWLGMFVSIVADSFTVKGCQLFWPNPVWCYSGSNWDKKRLKTGGTGEMFILAITVAIASFLVISQPFSSAGNNLIQVAGTQIGIRDAVFRQYNTIAANNIVLAQIKGVHTVNRSPMDGLYWAIGQEASEFILSKDGDIYRTGTSGQIITNSIRFQQGESASISVMPIAFDDEPIIPRLEELRSQFPEGSAIFLTGNITIDFPEDLTPAIDPLKLPTLALSGSSVNLVYHPIEQAIVDLRDQYAIGNLQAKIFSVKPEGF